MTLHYQVITYGCQMNERDSETIAGLLESIGYCPTEDENEADIIMLNTCAVRETAENKVWGKVGFLKALKAKNPDLILGICGCMSQQAEIAETIKDKYPHMDLVIGTHNLHRLPELVQQIKEGNQAIYEVWQTEGEIVEALPSRRADGLKAFVTIMYGCNNFCTYCIVPHVRGRERSRRVDDIKQEIEGLVAEGYKEVTLLGQNVNSYGKDLEPKVSFAQLLWQLDEIEGLKRIRFTSSHPKDLSEDLIETMAKANKVCEHLHLPVQAGSNSILKAMNRKYTREHYLELVDRLRSAVPDIALSTDLIVGFPGETEADFEATLDLLDQVRFDAAFTFVYNKRTGTPAAELNNQVNDEEKQKRIAKLIEQQNEISLKQNQEDVGKEMEVLVEGPSRTNEAMMTGRTRTNKIVNFPGNPSLRGELVKVKITGAKTWHLVGEML